MFSRVVKTFEDVLFVNAILRIITFDEISTQNVYQRGYFEVFSFCKNFHMRKEPLFRNNLRQFPNGHSGAPFDFLALVSDATSLSINNEQ